MAQAKQNQDFQVIEGGLVDDQTNPSRESLSYSRELLNPSQDSKLWTTSELAERYDTSTRTVQKMVSFVLEAYHWLDSEQLKQGASSQTRYTSLCIRYLDDLDTAKKNGMNSRQWVDSVLADNQSIDGEIVDEPQSQANQLPPSPGGSLTTYDSCQQAGSIINFNFSNLNVGIQSSDTQALDAQTDHARQVTANAANILRNAVSAKFQSDIKQVIAQNENLAAGIQAGALVDTVQNLGLGKPDRPSESTSQSS